MVTPGRWIDGEPVSQEADARSADRIPLVDLKAQHAEIAAEVGDGWARVVERGAFVLGEEVRSFERAFARFTGVRHCIGVGNGTDALELALRGAGVRSGDEVILPANSFIASAFAVVRLGAKPVPVDVDRVRLLIDPEQVIARLGPGTAAIMPVHLYGQVAPVEELRALAPEGVCLVEDASQAHGATRHGRVAGGFGSASGTSFYPSKNLGAYGDAGAVLTDSDEVARRVRILSNQGSEARDRHVETGFNSRLDTLQAVVLEAKLQRLARWNAARREAAARYARLLADLEQVRIPEVLPGNEHVWHLYVVRVPRRDEVVGALRGVGIDAGVHYPVPIHLQDAFHDLGYARGAFPVAEESCREILSLPMFPHITAAQQERVVDELGKALA